MHQVNVWLYVFSAGICNSHTKGSWTRKVQAESARRVGDISISTQFSSALSAGEARQPWAEAERQLSEQ